MKAVIFDFNGTLFDDTRFHMESWQRFMHRKFGLELTLEEVKKRFIGPNNTQIFNSCFPGRFSAEEIYQLGCEKEAEYRAVARSKPENMHLVEGAEALFDLLRERGIPFALATSSIYDNVVFYLEELGLKKWFPMEKVIYDDGRLAAKPDPAFYLEAAKRLNVDIGECVIAEDSPSGIQAAINAGAGRIIAIDRSAPMDWLKSNPAIHAVVHDFLEFEQFL